MDVIIPLPSPPLVLRRVAIVSPLNESATLKLRRPFVDYLKPGALKASDRSWNLILARRIGDL